MFTLDISVFNGVAFQWCTIVCCFMITMVVQQFGIVGVAPVYRWVTGPSRNPLIDNAFKMRRNKCWNIVIKTFILTAGPSDMFVLSISHSRKLLSAKTAWFAATSGSGELGILHEYAPFLIAAAKWSCAVRSWQ